MRDLRTGEIAPKASRRDLLVLAGALAAIVLGSVGMVHAATDLGRRWGVSDVIVGTLVLAALTSLPNLLTAVRLALHGRGAAVVSESFNSNSLNVLAGIALPSLALSLGSATGLVTFSVWWLVGMTAVKLWMSSPSSCALAAAAASASGCHSCSTARALTLPILAWNGVSTGEML